MTAKGLFRKMGTAPSHTAQAEIPDCQYVSSPGRYRRLAEAPVAMMMLISLASVVQEVTRSLRVGSHEVCFFLLSLRPVFERPLREVHARDRLGDDLGTESLAVRVSCVQDYPGTVNAWCVTYDWARNLSIISGPVTPSGKPGKFST